MRLHLIAICLGLSACAVSPAGVGGKSAPTVDSKPEVIVITGAQARVAVRNFIAVVQAVEPVAEATCSRIAPELNCDFRIVVDDDPGAPMNAYQTLSEDGQPVIVFTVPLIAVMRNRDELAFIMAHEAAHHIRGHLETQRRNASVAANVFGGIADVLGGGDTQSIASAQQLGAAIGARAYSKDFELEADALGTVIAAQSGFDPVLGAAFFARLPDPGNSFMGTHPGNEERLDTVRRVARGL